MLELLSEPVAVAVIGLVGGMFLGLAARLGRFCTLGAIEDAMFGGSTIRLRMWGLAIGLAVTGSYALTALGLIDPNESFYLSVAWSPLGSIVGGLMFGYGMAIAGNCGFGALARLGGGDLRAFVIVLVMGIATYASFSGPFGPLRVVIFGSPEAATLPQSIPAALQGISGVSLPLIGLVLGLVISAVSLWDNTFRNDRKSMFWAAVVSLSVLTAWVGTGHVARTGFDDLPMVSHTFAAPIGESILFFMTSTGQTLSFAIGSVAGVWLGAFIGSLIKGHFRWEACEDPRELRRQIFGAILMGAGAAIAMGCSIGQGLSAFSLLSFSAPVTLAAIFAGCWVGLTQLISGFHTFGNGRGRT